MKFAGRRGGGVPCPLFLLFLLLTAVARGDFRAGPLEEQRERVTGDQGNDDPVGRTDKILLWLHNTIAGEEKTATRLRQELWRASSVVNASQNTSANLEEARGQINVLRANLEEARDLEHEANVKLEIERNRSADLDLRLRNVTSNAARNTIALTRLHHLTEHLEHENMVLNNTLQKELAEREILRSRVQDMHHNKQVEVESSHHVEVEHQESDRELQRVKAELSELRNAKAQGDQRLRDEQSQIMEYVKQEQKARRQKEDAVMVWEKEIEKRSKGLENRLAVLKRELAESQAREGETLRRMEEDNATAEAHEKAVEQKLAAREKELNEVRTQEERLRAASGSQQEELSELRNAKAQGDQRLRDEQSQIKEWVKQEQRASRQKEENMKSAVMVREKKIEERSNGLENRLAVLKRELAESQAREGEALRRMEEDKEDEKAVEQKLAAREKELNERTQEEVLRAASGSQQEERSTGKLVFDLQHQVTLLTNRNREANSARDRADEEAKRAWAEVAQAKAGDNGLKGQLPDLRSKVKQLVQFAESEIEKADAAYKDRDSTALLLNKANGDLARLKEQFVKARQELLAARKSPQGLKVKLKPMQGSRAGGAKASQAEVKTPQENL